MRITIKREPDGRYKLSVVYDNVKMVLISHHDTLEDAQDAAHDDIDEYVSSLEDTRDESSDDID